MQLTKSLSQQSENFSRARFERALRLEEKDVSVIGFRCDPVRIGPQPKRAAGRAGAKPARAIASYPSLPPCDLRSRLLRGLSLYFVRGSAGQKLWFVRATKGSLLRFHARSGKKAGSVHSNQSHPKAGRTGSNRGFSSPQSSGSQEVICPAIGLEYLSTEQFAAYRSSKDH